MVLKSFPNLGVSLAKLMPRLPALCALYLLVELWRFRTFRRLLRRLRARNYTYQGGKSFLPFVKKVLLSKDAPLTLDRQVFDRFATSGESATCCGYGGGPLDWQRMYAWWAWGCGRPFDAPHSPELHAELLEVTAASCKALGLEAPPASVPAPSELAVSPFGYGCCEIRAAFKPLPVRLFLRSVQLASRVALGALGLRKTTEPMPEGELVCWTDLPQPGSPRAAHLRPDRRPVVFLHGLGMGNFTYLPLFIGKSSAEWRAGGCILLELPCMTSAWSDLESLPKVSHYADALARVLRRHLGSSADCGYDVVCHSLSAYLASVLSNEGSPCRSRKTVLVDPVCFLEGVEVCSRFPFRTPEECRVFAEATVLFPSFLPIFTRRMLGVIFRQLVCRDIFTQYSVLRWNGTDGTGVLWRNADAEALVCLSDDDHFVPSERVARHCEAHFPNVQLYHMPGKDHGSFVIEAKVRQDLLTQITAFLTGRKITDLY